MARLTAKNAVANVHTFFCLFLSLSLYIHIYIYKHQIYTFHPTWTDNHKAFPPTPPHAPPAPLRTAPAWGGVGWGGGEGESITGIVPYWL